MSTTLYTLQYDQDTGGREEWNVFYTPLEIYSTEELRQARIDELKQEVDEDGDPMNYHFHKEEIILDQKPVMEQYDDSEVSPVAVAKVVLATDILL